ncbi:hypothetical protein P154DRAFT_121491 [Amniculicola lignicola CBS 123094]|uniref:Uncharacterized protein n=1 Tax=Amniculicola lignicola CBS 123094 TaxID=1392246 RepID=A0A6A5X3U2_9PLEO|nr:hypothetical protein P154DRAFT_121491 [Amniculicola lignicola CBS 123094]
MRLNYDKVGDGPTPRFLSRSFQVSHVVRSLVTFGPSWICNRAAMNGAQHRIVIGSEQPGILVTPENFRGASGLIHDLISASIDNRQPETPIQAPRYLNHETVRRLVVWIDRGVPYQQYLTYHDLVQLSSAIWFFRCDPERFRRVFSSNHRQDQIGPQELYKEAAGWTFINLIFGWESDFSTASRELIANFTSGIPGMGISYFPSPLTSSVRTSRLNLVISTFRFIKNSVIENLTFHAPTFNRLAQQLQESGIDVTLREEDYTKAYSLQPIENGESPVCHCPKKMLDLFEDILIDRPVPGRPIEELSGRKPNENSSTSGSASARDTASAAGTGISADLTETAEMLSTRDNLGINEGSLRGFMWAKVRYRKTKKAERKSVQLWSNQHILQFDEIASGLRGRIISHRQEHFHGLDLSHYQNLRRQRLLLPVGQTQ